MKNNNLNKIAMLLASTILISNANAGDDDSSSLVSNVTEYKQTRLSPDRMSTSTKRGNQSDGTSSSDESEDSVGGTKIEIVQHITKGPVGVIVERGEQGALMSEHSDQANGKSEQKKSIIEIIHNEKNKNDASYSDKDWTVELVSTSSDESDSDSMPSLEDIESGSVSNSGLSSDDESASSRDSYDDTEDSSYSYYSYYSDSEESTNSATITAQNTRMGDLAASAMSNLLGASESSNAVLAGRLNDVSVAAGEESSITYGAWLKGLFGVNNTKLKSGSVKGKSAGFVLGADTAINEDIVAGIAYSYTNNKSKLDNAKRDITTSMLNVYGSKNLTDELSIRGNIGYGVSEINFEDTTKSKAKANILTGDVAAVYSAELANNIFVTPSLGLAYSEVTLGSAKVKDLNISKSKARKLDLTSAVSISTIAELGGVVAKPDLTASYSHALSKNGKALDVTNNVGTKAVSVKDKIASGNFKLGTGVTFIKDNIEFGGGYEYGIQKNSSDHTGFLKLRVNF